MTTRLRFGLALLLCVLPAAAQKQIPPPPDNAVQNIFNWWFDFWGGRERHTTCYDYCAGQQPRSICTTTIYEGGKATSYYKRDLPYPQNSNFKCDYPEGNPGGDAVITGVVPSYQDGNALDNSVIRKKPDFNTGTASPQPFLQIPFPPLYEGHTLPSPQGCTPTPGRDTLFVNHDLGTVSRVTACGGNMVANIRVGSRPLKIAVTPDQKLALVTMYDGGIAYIDLTSNNVAFTLPTPPDVHPSGIDITPDGTQAWVTNYFDTGASVLVIDIAGRKIVNNIPVNTFPQSVYISPDGLLAWVTLPFNNAIYIIDTLTQTVIRTLGVVAPYGLAFNSTGTRAYIANNSLASVQVLYTATYQTVKTYTVGSGPVDVAVSNDDHFLFVTNNGSGSITIIDLINGGVQNIPVGPFPRGLAQVQ